MKRRFHFTHADLYLIKRDTCFRIWGNKVTNRSILQVETRKKTNTHITQ